MMATSTGRSPVDGLRSARVRLRRRDDRSAYSFNHARIFFRFNARHTSRNFSLAAIDWS
jgi:hypothetical protein